MITETQTPPTMEPLVLTLEQTAKILNVSVPTVRRRVKDGSVPSVRIGGLIRVPYKRFVEAINTNVQPVDVQLAK